MVQDHGYVLCDWSMFDCVHGRFSGNIRLHNTIVQPCAAFDSSHRPPLDGRIAIRQDGVWGSGSASCCCIVQRSGASGHPHLPPGCAWLSHENTRAVRAAHLAISMGAGCACTRGPRGSTAVHRSWAWMDVPGWHSPVGRSHSLALALALSRSLSLARARALSLFLSNAFCLILVGACVRVCVCACVGGREGVWGWCVDGCVRAHVTMPCVNVHHFFVFWVDAPTCKNLHMCV